MHGDAIKIDSPKHVGDWVVADVVGDADPAQEELDSEVRRLARVEQDPALLVCPEAKSHVRLGLCVQRVKRQERVVVAEMNSGQVLAMLSW